MELKIDVDNFEESDLDGWSIKDLKEYIGAMADKLAHAKVVLGDKEEELDCNKHEYEEVRDRNAELEGDIKDVLSAARDFSIEHKECFPGCDCRKGCGMVGAFNHFYDEGYGYLVKL